MPKIERQYGTQKTTLPEGKTEYQRDYMRDYRKRQNAKIEQLKQRLHEIESLFGINYEYEVI
jgi:hypothetical protein